MPVPGMLECRNCGKTNTDDMRFCIHCGSAIASASALISPVGGAVNVDVSKVGLLVICPSCGKADVLNGLFCIFCGAKALDSLHSQEAIPTSGANLKRHDISPRALDPAMASRLSSQGKVAVLAITILLGLAVGGGAMYIVGELLHRPDSSASLPDKGLVVGSAKPYTKVLIALPGTNGKPDGRSFMLGKTSADGTLSLANLPDGSYDVALIADGAVKLQSEMSLKKSRPSVLCEDGCLLPKK